MGKAGVRWLIETLASVMDAGRRRHLALHLDRARLWHASVVTGIGERDYAKHFDSANVCFSKALGVPIGSCLAGPRDYIARARRFKQQIGGGFRQAGIIAAGALSRLMRRPGTAPTAPVKRQSQSEVFFGCAELLDIVLARFGQVIVPRRFLARHWQHMAVLNHISRCKVAEVNPNVLIR